MPAAPQSLRKSRRFMPASLVEEIVLPQEIGHHAAPGPQRVVRVGGALLLLARTAVVALRLLQSLRGLGVLQDAGEEAEGALDLLRPRPSQEELVKMEDRLPDLRVALRRAGDVVGLHAREEAALRRLEREVRRHVLARDIV